MVTPRTGRPRGRPPGAKNKPKTAEAFILESLTVPIPEPQRKPKGPATGAWATMTPKQRSAYSRRISKGVDRRNCGQGRKPGVPTGRTYKQQAQIVAEQQPEIRRILKKMAQQGELPDDPMAVESLKESLTVLRTSKDHKMKLAAARLILDFTKSKPTAKVEHTVRTAEDFLDELGADEE